jgi:ethanolamine permease
MLSYFKIARRDINRPYKSPGGKLFAAVAFLLALIALFACFSIPDYRPGVIGVVVWYLLGMLWFALISRKNLVAEAPEEEYALIEKAQKELKH